MRKVSKLSLSLAMIVSAVLLVALDQWTKALAAAFLAGRGTVSLVGDLAVLVYAKNRGAFLSLGSGLSPALRTLLLIALPLVALAFLGWAFLSKGLGGRGKGGAAGRAGAMEMSVVVLVAAGGLGNLADRILYGEVRDFLNFGIGRLRTGIMNLADLYILAALIVMAVALARKPRKGGPRKGEPEEPSASS